MERNVEFLINMFLRDPWRWLTVVCGLAALALWSHFLLAMTLLLAAFYFSRRLVAAKAEPNQ
jgi:hypothetical protein